MLQMMMLKCQKEKKQSLHGETTENGECLGKKATLCRGYQERYGAYRTTWGLIEMVDGVDMTEVG